MHALTSATVEVPLALGRALDYAVEPESAPQVGSVVRVTVGRRSYAGVVTAVGPYAGPHRLKPLGSVLAAPLAPALLALADFVAEYYQVTRGVAYGLLMPAAAAPEASVLAWRLTDAGQDGLAALPARRRLARELAARLDPEGVLSVASIEDAGDGLRREFASWRKAGWLAPVAAAAQDAAPAAERGCARLPAFTTVQRAALAGLAAEAGRSPPRPVLLHGVTGSGKTAIFLARAAGTIAAGRQVLLLVPEINLTPQLTDSVRAALPAARIALLHSRVAPGERNRAWHAAHAGEADLVIGTRLSVFASLPRLGLIIVDEEHDGSYKQDDSPRYHARDVAVMRGHLEGVPVVLASATPSLESWQNMRLGRYGYVHLAERATQAPLPTIRLIPARGQRQQRQGGVALGLVDAIRDRLARGEQSLVLVNRRGFAPALYCPHCAWTAPCRHCDAKLTWHQVDRRLRCHHCGWQEAPPTHCPACGHAELAAVGVGTQRVEAALRERLPEARIARADSDALSGRQAWETLFRRMQRREIDVLVGTQMLAKGHDFPHLTLVGVLEADRALFSTDFRAQEDLLALLTQVAGRAGRHVGGDGHAGDVIVQTDFPEHEVYRTLISGDFAGFADTLLERRRALGLPPATRMALVRAEGKRAHDVEAFFDYAAGVIRGALTEGQVYAPQAAPLARKAGETRWLMVVVAPRAKTLQAALATLAQTLRLNRPRVKWVIDVDPYDFG
jgi:primosomal protein N' (replication factor Y)